MGCTSSVPVALPSAIVPAAGAAPAPASEASPQANLKKVATEEESPNKGSNQTEAVPAAAAEQPVAVAVLSAEEQQQLDKKQLRRMKRLTSDERPRNSSSPTPVAAAAAAARHHPAASPACDTSPSHDPAVVFCSQCEEHYCAACDLAVHPHAPAHKHEHRRTRLSGGRRANNNKGEGAEEEKENAEPKPKFVLPPQTDQRHAADAHSDAAAAQPAESSSSGVVVLNGARQFKVAQFASSGGPPPAAVAAADSSSAAAAADPAAAPHPHPRHSALMDINPDLNSSVGTRLRHGPSAGHAILNTLGASELAHMNRYELEMLWHRYDADRKLVLGRREIALLTQDVITRLLKLVRDDLVAKHPHMSEQQIDEALENEKFLVLPGKNQKETRKEMTRMLQRTLDINHDGKISKEEYLAQWNGEWSNTVAAACSAAIMKCGMAQRVSATASVC